jgi:hypothetical protein
MIFFPIFPPLESFPHPFPSGAGVSLWTTAPSRTWERRGKGEISNILARDFASYFTRFIFLPELPKDMNKPNHVFLQEKYRIFINSAISSVEWIMAGEAPRTIEQVQR